MQDKERLQQVCQEIAEEGLTPGVGLVRARAPFKISVAQAIEALKSYKQGKPVAKKAEKSETQPGHPALESRVHVLEERVKTLEGLLQQVLSKHSG